MFAEMRRMWLLTDENQFRVHRKCVLQHVHNHLTVLVNRKILEAVIIFVLII